jgi:DNA-binding ferritin-like protein
VASKQRQEKVTPKIRPAATPEGRENQLVSMAVDLAERQLQDGTASAQVISHYLKLGSTRERLEQERLARENELLNAKVKHMASAERIEELYKTALNAMRSYAGQEELEYEDDED